MAQRNAAELIAGAAILVVAAGFLGYGVVHSGRTPVSGITLHARFGSIAGLAIGSDVRMAGVKVGSVTAARLDPQTYQADVDFTVASSVRVPKDSSAAVTSDGLLGGKYLSVEPGGDEQMLASGGQITITQSSISLEQLLGKFIFSIGGAGGQPKGDGDQKPVETPGAAPK
jgi:phospholipid/cholesterol/gamma-HCH transport system substrate-binding protein